MPNNQNLTLQKNRESGSSKTNRLTHAQHALGNTKSLRKAINAKCWDCGGGGLTEAESKGTRKEIALCTITDCSLHHFRPYKNKETANTLTGVAVSDLSFQQNHEDLKNEI